VLYISIHHAASNDYSRIKTLPFALSLHSNKEALTRLLVEIGIFAKEEFLERVRVVDKDMRGKRRNSQ